jgi:hypothetical protein
MEGNLPAIDYSAYDPNVDHEAVLAKCRMESLMFVGKPSAETVAKVDDEEVPDRIQADFKTSADDAQWRG